MYQRCARRFLLSSHTTSSLLTRCLLPVPFPVPVPVTVAAAVATVPPPKPHQLHQATFCRSFRTFQSIQTDYLDTDVESDRSMSSSSTTPTKANVIAISPLKPFALVVAATSSGGIGHKGNLPWPQRSLPADMAFFKETTSTVDAALASTCKNVVIMGRRTWESIPAKFRPLPGRINIILSRDGKENLRESIKDCVDTYLCSSLYESLQFIRDSPSLSDRVEKVFVIGGSALYREAIQSPLCHTIYLTRVLKEFECDTHLAAVDCTPSGDWKLEKAGDVVVENGIPFQFQTIQRKVKGTEMGNPEEQQYLDLVSRVIREGVQKGDRTGTGTLSIFGAQTRFSLRNGQFPLLTSKRVFWRGVVEELLWLVKGQTDSKIMAEKKVHIWDDNGSRAFLDKLGFSNREVGDLGPVYGFQWRFFGAEYKDCKTDYSGQGVDQLAQLIHTIKTNPNDRRILLSAWNPVDLPKMALPPCHVMCQFYVANNELSCQMYQRSNDLGLGVPFNIASYSLLTVMIAHLCGLKPGEFVHCMGDTHVYLNHVEPLQQQLQRTPRPFPTLSIKRKVDKIEDFVFEDFVLEGYKPLEAIKMQMAV